MRFCFLARFNPMTNTVTARVGTNYRRLDARRSCNLPECRDFTTKHSESFYFVVNGSTFKNCLDNLDTMQALGLYHSI